MSDDTKLKGLLAAPYTAMTANGDLNLKAVESQAELLRGYGVRGVFVGGTTGEGLSLTTEERIALAERWLAAVPDDFAVLVHVSHTSLRETERIMLALRNTRVRGFGALGPFFFKPQTLEDLVDYSAAVASLAPEVPFYYYHIPSMSGVTASMRGFLEMAAPRIPNLRGAKFTHEDLRDYQQCLEFEGGRFQTLFGRDEMLLAGLSLGATGAIGSTYNYAGPLYRKLWNAFSAGDLEEARRCQSNSQLLIGAMRAHRGVVIAGKSLMKTIGVDCGPCRSPLRSLSNEEESSFRKALEGIGFFEWSGNA